MKLYLDVCCFNRPFDDQNNELIHLETEAKLMIQNKIKDGVFGLVWSYILDYENSMNPYPDRSEYIKEWKVLAIEDISETSTILAQAKNLLCNGIKPKDALHVACAIEACCDYLITTDKDLIKKCMMLDGIIVLNPLDFMLILEEE